MRYFFIKLFPEICIIELLETLNIFPSLIIVLFSFSSLFPFVNFFGVHFKMLVTCFFVAHRPAPRGLCFMNE